MKRTRNRAWIVDDSNVVLPRGQWRRQAIDGATIRHGAGVEISEGSVSVDGRHAGVCLVAVGSDGTKTVLARFARSTV